MKENDTASLLKIAELERQNRIMTAALFDIKKRGHGCGVLAYEALRLAGIINMKRKVSSET